MAPRHANSKHVTNEERRDFLKAIGATGAVAAGGVTLDEINRQLTSSSEELAPVGQAIKSDVSGSINAELITRQQQIMVDAVNELPLSLERGLPSANEGPRTEFERISQAGWPVYDHLNEIGFFGSASQNLPDFNLETLGNGLEIFVSSDQLVDLMNSFEFGQARGVDLLATVIGNAEDLQKYHWVANEDFKGPDGALEEAFPSAPQAAAGGVLLWLDDIDLHLYQKAVLITEEIHADAVWHSESMATGFFLMSEAAKQIGEATGELTENELGALLTTSFAVQAISQGILPEDVYWITEEMRANKVTN